MKQQNGVIRSVEFGMHEHYGVLTTSIGIEFDGGHGGQSFGGITFDERTGPIWKALICATFGVEKYEDLVGMHCVALRCFDSYNEEIQGLEAPNGNRFTIQGFRRYAHPDKGYGTVLDERIQRIKDAINCAERSIRERRQELDTVRGRYTEWG